MTVAPIASRESAALPEHSPTASSGAEASGRGNRAKLRRAASADPHRYASDDEILGISASAVPVGAAQLDAASNSVQDGTEADASNNGAEDRDSADAASDPLYDAQPDPQIQAALDASPELRQAWQDAQSYREAFATPEEARAATALLGDLDRMDALFFSQRPEDHAELARAVANLDPKAFASLAKAMNDLSASGTHASQQSTRAAQTRTPDPSVILRSTATKNPSSDAVREILRSAQDDNASENTVSRPGQAPSPAEAEFLHAANAAAVQGVLEAIETQVDRLLPEGVSKSARNRVVGEIYRELDASLGANRQLGQQMRDAFRSGNLDAAHQRAIVALVTGRARQALPGIAKRVLNEWTSTVITANQDRLTRQRTAAHRVDIAGSGRGADGGRRSLGPRDIDYGRMSDSDILNL
jgi:hypothetical protein